MIKLGRIDIISKVLLLSSHVVLPWEGHLDAALHVMVHVGQRYNTRVVHDPFYAEIDHSVIKKRDWSEYYRDVEEAILVNAP